MKTLKEFIKESEAFYQENAATYFSKGYNKKMKGTQVIVFENDFIAKIELDDREYYQGRGAKYNNNSMHEHVDTFVTLQEFNERVNHRAKNLFERQKEKAVERKKMREFCKQHKLSLSNYTSTYPGPSYPTVTGLYFERSKQNDVEKELGVDLNDFFNATGKTYYFAETKIGFARFYHNHHQYYSFDLESEWQFKEFKKNRKEWLSSPYVHLLGNIDNDNLYVC